jgi:ATP-binding protein involved in chromosome partitioning
MRIAIPVSDGLVSPHFARCGEFALYDVEEGKVKNRASAIPPPHGPGVLPQWLKEQGANVIIASGMGMRAQALFSEQGIDVVLGAAEDSPDDTVAKYLNGTLETGDNVCDH